MCFGGGKKASSDSGQAASGGAPAAPTGSGPGGREKTTDEFYEEMKPGPYELPSLGTGEAPVTRAPIAYGTITPTQRPGLPQRSLLIPFIRPAPIFGTFKKSGG